MSVLADPRADPRAEQAFTWATSRLALPDAEFAPASADASFRRYFRLRRAGKSWIVMDAPPERENSRPFVAVARLLRGWGLNVPEILAEDLDRGFLLLSDLGTQTYLDALRPESADELYRHGVEALLRMQACAQREPTALGFLPAYDATLLWREVRLFSEWYLPRHLNQILSAEEANELERAMGLLVKSALAQPRTFVHRDYMPRNLMISDPSTGGASGGVREETSRGRLVSPGILDFQDAVLGPHSYDVICLFKDAFLSWEPARVQGWVQGYWEAARRENLPVPASFDDFWRQAEWMGLQRHLKVLGIFARLTYRDGKTQYVADTPRFVRYVMEVAPRYPELAPLVALFERRVLPHVAT